MSVKYSGYPVRHTKPTLDQQCNFITKSGKHCKRKAMIQRGESPYCAIHARH